MKVNIYYGGRGVLDDPTLYVIQKMESVLMWMALFWRRPWSGWGSADI